MRARSILVPAVALGLALSGCGGDDGDEAGPESSLLPPQSTEAATGSSSTGEAGASEPGTSEGGATTTSAPSVPTAFTEQAADAINELEAAWEAGDQARARAIAPGEVVEALFLVPPEGFEVYGCDSGEFETSTCNFRNRSTEAFIVVTATRTDPGWQVSTIDINTD